VFFFFVEKWKSHSCSRLFDFLCKAPFPFLSDHSMSNPKRKASSISTLEQYAMHPETMICMRCKQPGHGARFCPSKSHPDFNPLNALFGDSDSDETDSEESFKNDCLKPKPSKSSKTSEPITQQQHRVKTLSERHAKQVYASKSAEYGANQQWNRLCRFWNELARTDEVANKSAALFEPDVFDNISPEMLTQPIESLLFQVSHLQRAHLLSIYIEQLSPTAKGLTHYDGSTLKGYIDDIVRKLKAEECKNQKLSSYYGNWSWKTNCEYRILNDTLASKIIEEDARFRGQKQANACTSDSISMKSWKLLVSETTAKRDRYKAAGDLENFIKTNASLCVLIHTLFCGCRAQQEIANFIVSDFKDLGKFCIEFKLSGDFKTRKLINFKFTDRQSSFIFGEENCEPFRIFLYNRPPNAIDRLFLYHMPSARFGEKVLLSAAKQIGPKVLAKSVQNEVESLVAGGFIMEGLYTNTSLRKGLTDRLALAGVPTVLVDLAVGHFNSKGGRTSSVFQDTPNLNTYLSLWKQTNTRKKIAFLIYQMNMCWKDIADDDDFLKCYQTSFPNFDAYGEILPQPEVEAIKIRNIPSPLPSTAVHDSSDMFQLDSFPDELFLSFLTPPELKRKQQPTQQQNFAQNNTSMAFNTSMAPILHIHGGNVSINFSSAKN
jgi:hypothetical protein